MRGAAALCIHPSPFPAWQPSASHESAIDLIWARGWGSDVASGRQNEFRLSGPWLTVHHHQRRLFLLQTFDPPPPCCLGHFPPLRATAPSVRESTCRWGHDACRPLAQQAMAARWWAASVKRTVRWAGRPFSSSSSKLLCLYHHHLHLHHPNIVIFFSFFQVLILLTFSPKKHFKCTSRVQQAPFIDLSWMHFVYTRNRSSCESQECPRMWH